MTVESSYTVINTNYVNINICQDVCFMAYYVDLELPYSLIENVMFLIFPIKGLLIIIQCSVWRTWKLSYI